MRRDECWQSRAAGWLLVVAALPGWWLADIPSAPTALHAFGQGLLESARCLHHGVHGRIVRAARRCRQSVAPWERPAAGSGHTLVLRRHARVAGRQPRPVAISIAGLLRDADVAARLCLLIGGVLLAVGVHRALVPRYHASVATDRALRSPKLLAAYVTAAISPSRSSCSDRSFIIAAYDIMRALIGTLIVLVIAGTIRVLFLRPQAGENMEPSVNRHFAGAGWTCCTCW
jgi:hypothetical protein